MTRPGARRWWGLAAACGGLFLVGGVLLAAEPHPTGVDQGVHDAVQRVNPTSDPQWGDQAWQRTVDNVVKYGLYAAAVGLVAYRAGARPALVMAGAWVLLELVVHATKLWVDRPRPPGATATSAAYPSGHVASFGAVALAFALVVFPLWRGDPRPRAAHVAAAFFLAALVAAYRIVTGNHWLTDTIGGVLLATAAAATLRTTLPSPSRPR